MVNRITNQSAILFSRNLETQINHAKPVFDLMVPAVKETENVLSRCEDLGNVFSEMEEKCRWFDNSPILNFTGLRSRSNKTLLQIGGPKEFISILSKQLGNGWNQSFALKGSSVTQIINNKSYQTKHKDNSDLLNLTFTCTRGFIYICVYFAPTTLLLLVIRSYYLKSSTLAKAKKYKKYFLFRQFTPEKTKKSRMHLCVNFMLGKVDSTKPIRKSWKIF